MSIDPNPADPAPAPEEAAKPGVTPGHPADDRAFRAALADTMAENDELLRRLAAGDRAAGFGAAARYVLAKNAELYRRLAAGGAPENHDAP